MALSIQIEGLDEYVAALVRAPEVVSKELRTTLKTEMEEIDRLARQNHRYTSRSGNLEKSIDSTVSNDGLTAKIWVSKTKSNAPYAYRIHSGFTNKYDVLGRYFTGPEPDEFLYNAVKVRCEDANSPFLRNIELAVMRGFMKAGL